MPAICEGCRFYAPAETAGPCPACGKPLKFTLLPPPGVAPDPLPLAAADERPLRRWELDAAAPGQPWLYEWLTSTTFLALVGVAGFVLLLAGLWVFIARANGDPAFAPK